MAKSTIKVELSGNIFEPGRDQMIRAEVNKELSNLLVRGEAMVRLRTFAFKGGTGKFRRNIHGAAFPEGGGQVISFTAGAKRDIIKGRTLEKRMGLFRRSTSELVRQIRREGLASDIADRLNA